MSAHNTSSDPAVRNFWDRYINKLKKQGVKTKMLRWYVILAEQYLKAFPDKKLVTHRPHEVQTFLEKAGRKQGFEDWQYHQIVDAIQNLFELINVDWLEQVDWEFWKNSARSLSPDHPTIARDMSAAKSGQMSHESKDGDTVSARAQHKDVMTSLTNEIRRRGYSIRTEQAYEGWAARFIAFSGNQDPKCVGTNGQSIGSGLR